MLAYYPDRFSPLLVKFGQGAAPPAAPEAFIQKSPGKKISPGKKHLSEARWLPWLGRTFGISGGGVH